MERLIDAIETRRMELIDRRKLVSDFWKGVEDGAILSYDDTDELMENAPTVDAVEVVRCRDCAKDGLFTCPICFIENKTLHFINHSPDFYCGEGERKDGGGNG